MALPPDRKRPILLVDDSHEDLFFVKRLLARAGIGLPIVTVDGGVEAEGFLRECVMPGARELKPAIIFCDVKMPGRNGFEVLEWIRGQRALDDVPVYMLSGADLDTDRDRALNAGATGYLAKFPRPEDLKLIIDRAARAADGNGS